MLRLLRNNAHGITLPYGGTKQADTAVLLEAYILVFSSAVTRHQESPLTSSVADVVNMVSIELSLIGFRHEIMHYLVVIIN